MKQSSQGINFHPTLYSSITEYNRNQHIFSHENQLNFNIDYGIILLLIKLSTKVKISKISARSTGANLNCALNKTKMVLNL